jgi:hypothetical protein
MMIESRTAIHLQFMIEIVFFIRFFLFAIAGLHLQCIVHLRKFWPLKAKMTTFNFYAYKKKVGSQPGLPSRPAGSIGFRRANS